LVTVDCADILFGVSTEACKVLSTSLAEKSEFNLSDHKAAVRTASTTARKDRAEQELGVLETRWAEKGLREKWRLKRAMNAGIWLTCIPSRLNGTEISAEEFVDNIRLRYNLQPLHVPECCDGCGKPMSVEHAMSCKVGGLVHIRHDDVAQEFGYLCGLAYKPSRVSYKPLISRLRRRVQTLVLPRMLVMVRRKMQLRRMSGLIQLTLHTQLQMRTEAT
jgi:hypothetical protein